MERMMGLRALRRAPALSRKMPNSIGIFLSIRVLKSSENQKPPFTWEFFRFSGADDGTRTHNNRHGKAVL